MLTALADIWASYRRQPLWVQLWIGIFLVPINFASVLFLDGPAGYWVAALAIGGIFPNVILCITLIDFPFSFHFHDQTKLADKF